MIQRLPGIGAVPAAVITAGIGDVTRFVKDAPGRRPVLRPGPLTRAARSREPAGAEWVDVRPTPPDHARPGEPVPPEPRTADL